jgi:hypothetical protein
MLRICFVVLVGVALLATASPARAAAWADGMFDELSKDFGSVQRGPTLTHHFRVTNNTSSSVHIANVRVSCGCVTASATQTHLAPGEAAFIIAQMDTRRFVGIKTVTIYVEFDRPRRQEVRLWVQANGRDDVMVSPDTLAFGRVKRATSPDTHVTVTLMGGEWQITGAQSESNYIQPALKVLRQDGGERIYDLTARLRPDAPVGKWYTDVWLATNNPSLPRVRVPLTVAIESALSVSPSIVLLDQVKAGTEAERKVIVRGVDAFRITGIEGADGEMVVRDASPESKPIHVLTVTVKTKRPGDLRRTFRVVTDLPDEADIEFSARARVIP